MKMSTKERASKAARVKNANLRKYNLEKYLSNPNICKGCGLPILPDENQVASEVSHKQFHNSKCFGLSNILPPKEKIIKDKKERYDLLSLKSKSDFYSDKHFHSRIRFHSRAIYKLSGRDMKCFICGYDKHVEICHIKDIQDFDSNAKVSEINDENNLVALCANCHWEFDHGLATL